MASDLSFCRAEFPALDMEVNGHKVVFLDGPGGTQVPRSVVERVARYLTFENANVHGAWATSQATDRVLEEGRRAMADFLGARPDEIAFGQNMTSLNFALSRALGRRLGTGDEVVITELDHEANRGPWLALEEDGVKVREARVNPETRTLDLDDLRAKIGPRTRVVATGGASNAVGTVNDVKLVASLAHGVGAVCVVDAVHLAPHKPIDVREMGCDFLLCSAYKFFGPHVGVLYGSRQALERLDTYKVLPQSDEPPFKIETGTLGHEGIAGVAAAVEFVAGLGRKAGGAAGRTAAATGSAAAAQGTSPGAENAAGPGSDRRRAVLAGVAAIDAYEGELAAWFMSQLKTIPGLRIYGPPQGHPRTPTVSVVLEGRPAEDISRLLAAEGVFAGAGDFYATTLVRRLGLEERGGLLRMGLAPYNTQDELERVVGLLRKLAAG